MPVVMPDGLPLSTGETGTLGGFLTQGGSTEGQWLRGGFTPGLPKAIRILLVVSAKLLWFYNAENSF